MGEVGIGKWGLIPIGETPFSEEKGKGEWGRICRGPRRRGGWIVVCKVSK